jgi:hypothetical protein
MVLTSRKILFIRFVYEMLNELFGDGRKLKSDGFESQQRLGLLVGGCFF